MPKTMSLRFSSKRRGTIKVTSPFDVGTLQVIISMATVLVLTRLFFSCLYLLERLTFCVLLLNLHPGEITTYSNVQYTCN